MINEIKGRKRIDLENPLTWYLIGVALSDGWIKIGQLMLLVKDKAFAEKFASVARAIGLHAKEPALRKESWETYTCSRELSRLAKRVKENPDIIRKLPEQCFLKFLEGFYEGDGSVTIEHGKRLIIKMEQKVGKGREKIIFVIGKGLEKLGLKIKLKCYIRNDQHPMNGKRIKNIYVGIYIRDKFSVYTFFNLINPVIKNPRTGSPPIYLLRKREDTGKIWSELWKALCLEILKQEARDWKVYRASGRLRVRIILTKDKVEAERKAEFLASLGFKPEINELEGRYIVILRQKEGVKKAVELGAPVNPHALNGKLRKSWKTLITQQKFNKT